MAVNGNVEVGGLTYTTAVGNLFVSGTITTSGSISLGTALVDASSDLVLSSSLNSIVAISGALEFPTNEKRHLFANNNDLILSSSVGNIVISGSASVLGVSSSLAQSGTLIWTGRSKLSSPADQQIQIQPNAGGNGTALVLGIVFGTKDTTGVSLVKNGSRIRSMNGDQTVNAGFEAAGLVMTGQGQGISDATGIHAVLVNFNNGVQIASNGSASFFSDQTGSIQIFRNAIITGSLYLNSPTSSIVATTSDLIFSASTGKTVVSGNLQVNQIGNSTLPSISLFDANTGFFRSGPGTLGVTTNATSSIVISPSQIFLSGSTTLTASTLLTIGAFTAGGKITTVGTVNATAIEAGTAQINCGELAITRTNIDAFRLQNNTSLRGSSSSSLGWTVGDAASTFADTALSRNYAGVVAFTTGSGIIGVGSWVAATGTLSGAINISGNINLSASSAIQWSGSTRLSSSANGTLQVMTSVGGLGSIIFGQADATGMQFTKTSSQLNVFDGGGSSQLNIACAQLFANSNVKVNGGGNTGFGLQLGSNTTSLFVKPTSSSLTNWTVLDQSNLAPGFINQGNYTLGKSAAYSLGLLDCGIHFTTNGAVATVPFTILSSTLGYVAKFTATAAQVMSVTALTGSIFGPGSLTGNTRIVSASVAANQYSSFDVYCYDGTNFVVRGPYGTII